jgi:predicted TIM-barrel fold metal-dependent hydrolase
MFASNFPVDKLYGSFAQHFSAYDQITSDFSQAERYRLFATTAEAVYRLS